MTTSKVKENCYLWFRKQGEGTPWQKLEEGADIELSLYLSCRAKKLGKGIALILPSNTKPEDYKPPFDIDPEFRSLIPPPSDQERAQLEANLLRDGECRDKVVFWHPPGAERPILLDGHNRYEICWRLAIPCDAHKVDLPDREAARRWILENQLGRRNLTDDQRAALAAVILESRAEASREEKASKAGRAGGKGRKSNSSEGTSTPKLSETRQRARKEVAAAAKVSEQKVRDAAELKKANPELHQRVAAGDVSLREAKKEARTKRLTNPEERAAREKKILELHAGGKNFKAIAEQLEVTTTFVSNVVHRAEVAKRQAEIEEARKPLLNTFLYEATGRLQAEAEMLATVPDDAWEVLSREHPGIFSRFFAACEALVSLYSQRHQKKAS